MHIDNSYGIDVVAANTNLVSKRVLKGEPFSTQIVCDEGYSVYEITIKMGGVDITSTAYDATYNMISIPSVIDDVDIECYAMHTMPSDYVRVDGIKNPSNAYLDTDYVPSLYTKVLVDALPDTNSAYIVANKTASWTSTYATGVRRYLTSVRAFFNNEEQNLSNPYTVGERFVVICDNYNGKLYYNGTLKKSFQRVNANDSYALCLFSRDRGNESSNSAGTIIYRTYIYDYSTTSYVRYYIPCLNDSGVAGFWDAARGVFQGSNNSTKFEEVFEGTTISSQFTKRTTAEGATLALPTAKVISVKGNTLVWNQCVKNGAFTAGTSNWQSYGDNTTIQGVDGALKVIPGVNNGGALQTVGIGANHHCYVRCYIDIPEGGGGTFMILADGSTRKSQQVTSGTSNVMVHTMYTRGNGNTTVFIFRFPVAGKEYYIRNICVFDFTCIYGAGQEPSTMTDFARKFPLTYYNYISGSLLNFTATSLASKNAAGTTIWNEALDVTTITGKVDGEGESVTIFPDGMKSVNSVYDEIVKEDGVWVAYKRIGSNNLGEVNYAYNSSYAAFFRTVQGVITGKNYIPFVLPKYSKASGVGQNNLTDKSYGVNTLSGKSWTDLYIKDSAYSDTTAFKNSLDGVMLYFELATPIKYVLDNPLPEYYKALTGGVEQILPENGATPTTSPANMSITYKTIE